MYQNLKFNKYLIRKGKNEMKTMEKRDFFKIGCSSAASWAWGTSLIMGQQIAQEKGIVAWLIWAICNSLTLALLGFLFNKKIITKELCDKKEVKIIALIIQLFCLLVQLNFINQQFLLITGSKIGAYLITIAIGFFFTLIVYRKGLPTSIKTDVGQWVGAIISIVAIIIIGLVTKAPLQEFAKTTPSGILWGIWSGLILFAGPIGDVQHWQRAEADTSKKGYYFGAFLFGLYMCLILGMAFFKFTLPMNIILLVAVLCVTTSTIDSIAVALHELGNKKIGTGIALALCVAFGVFVQMGMLQLWSSFGVIRFAFAIGILLLPLALNGNSRAVNLSAIVTYALMIFFAVNGQITINSIVGMVSFVIATIIIAYVVYIGEIIHAK